MDSEPISALISHGPIGIVCVILILACRKLYNDLARERTKHLTEQREVNERHTQEAQAFTERYINKTETLLQKYHDLANSTHGIINSLEKRIEIVRDAHKERRDRDRSGS